MCQDLFLKRPSKVQCNLNINTFRAIPRWKRLLSLWKHREDRRARAKLETQNIVPVVVSLRWNLIKAQKLSYESANLTFSLPRGVIYGAVVFADRLSDRPYDFTKINTIEYSMWISIRLTLETWDIITVGRGIILCTLYDQNLNSKTVEWTINVMPV